VYARPDINTKAGCAILFDKNETAAMLVARGHGLIDVKIPSHRAVKKIIR